MPIYKTVTHGGEQCFLGSEEQTCPLAGQAVMWSCTRDAPHDCTHRLFVDVSEEIEVTVSLPFELESDYILRELFDKLRHLHHKHLHEK
jgi:hypothetical protein